MRVEKQPGYQSFLSSDGSSVISLVTMDMLEILSCIPEITSGILWFASALSRLHLVTSGVKLVIIKSRMYFFILMQFPTLIIPVLTFLGMLTRATRGVRNQAKEMINNLQIIQCALRHSMDATMNSDLALFFTSRMTDRRRWKRGHRVEAHHLCNKEDTAVRLLFPHADIKFYQALNIGHIRLCTRSYSVTKIADDSNIIFRLNGSENFGRIRSILTVDDGEPLLFVAHLSRVSPLVCSIDEFEDFTYTRIQVSSDINWSYVLIEANDFVEKSVLYESLNGQCFFFRFPNLIHCS